VALVTNARLDHSSRFTTDWITTDWITMEKLMVYHEFIWCSHLSEFCGVRSTL